MKPSGSGLLCVSNFLFGPSILLIIGLFRFLLLPDSVLADCVFLAIYPFQLGCPISSHIVVRNIFCSSSYFCGIGCNCSSFISDFIYQGPLSFFLMNVVNGLSILFIFSKNQLLDSLILWIVFLFCMPFNSALIFLPSTHSGLLEFFLSFIYLFLQGEKHQCVVASYMPPTGDLACNPGMCPDWESNQ